jgi:hypothetical protein
MNTMVLFQTFKNTFLLDRTTAYALQGTHYLHQGINNLLYSVWKVNLDFKSLYSKVQQVSQA